jgi:hypothetical protein
MRRGSAAASTVTSTTGASGSTPAGASGVTCGDALGAWYSGESHDGCSNRYVGQVKAIMRERPWRRCRG